MFHLIEPVHTGGGLLGHPFDPVGDGAPPSGVFAQASREDLEHDGELLGIGRGRVGHGAGLLVLDALVDQQGGVTAVVEDHGGSLPGPHESLLCAPPVLLERLALPGEDRDAGRTVDGAGGAHGHRGGGVVLSGEDVAAGPAHLSAQGREGLDEDGGLDGHVEGTGDPRSGEGLLGTVLGAHGHQPRHLVLGQLDLLAAELGEREVGHLEVGGLGGGHKGSLAVAGSAWLPGVRRGNAVPCRPAPEPSDHRSSAGRAPVPARPW